MNSITIAERDLLHLRYKPKHENYRDCAEIAAFDLFDWVIWAPHGRIFQRFKKHRPRTVLCLAHPKSLRVLLMLRFLLKDVRLVVAGADANLSQLIREINVLIPHCEKVYFEAKDIEHPHVKSFGMGFISYYFKRLGDDAIMGMLANVRSEPWRKEGVLAAWGAIWKGLDDTISDRKNAARFIKNSDWLVREELAPSAYLQRLAESKYFVAPAGNGIQAPKLAEAWLMRTVPIVIKNPCFEDLSEMGYPFVFLDHWRQLSPVILENYEAKRLSIDWSRVEKMLTLDHFNEKILGACN